MMNPLVRLTTLLVLANCVLSANVLVLMPLAFYSHSSSFYPVLRALAARGHQVTVVSPYPQNPPVQNLTDVVVPNYVAEFLDKYPKEDLLKLNDLKLLMLSIWNLGVNGLEKAVQNEEIQKLIRTNDNNYDLVIIETYFAHELLVAFGHKFNAPVVNMMPLRLFPSAAYLTGNHFPLSYVPVIKPGLPSRMTFWQRVQNVLFYYADVLVGQMYYLRRQEELMNKYLVYPGWQSRPSLQTMLRNTSLTLLDAHYAVGYPTPAHKNLVYYGGAYLQNKHQPLPKDLQDILDNAEDGVIYFSFGSYSTISNLRPEMRDAIINALGRTNKKVLIKLDDPKYISNYPYKNIVVRKWFPQASVLEHPNCQLFITHCGLHGIMEAIASAKPMVAIPLIADQYYNAMFIESIGVAIKVTPQELTEQTLFKAINTVLNDPSYKERMNERSAIFKDNPYDIMDNVIYWIEYVIRHKGAPHLRPAVLDLHWYQHLMLDVIAFCLLIAFVAIFTIVKLIKLFYALLCIVFSLVFGKNEKKSKKNKNI